MKDVYLDEHLLYNLPVDEMERSLSMKVRESSNAAVSVVEPNHWRAPLFIVGASRSGTAMLRSILMQNKIVSLTGETHYFDDLRPRFIGKNLDEIEEGDLEVCCDYFRAQTDRPYGKSGNPENSWLSRKELLATAKKLGTDVDSLFEAYCKLSASRSGAEIWGEKTPRHIFRINDIVQRFPEARFICMIRDPRAVVASYRDWKFQGNGSSIEQDEDYKKVVSKEADRTRQSYHIIIASMMWRAAANAALQAQKTLTPRKVKIIKYEDVIAYPERVISDLCSWLDIEYQLEMLQVPLHNSSAFAFQSSAGVSQAPQNRWREVLARNEIAMIQSLVHGPMKKLNYEQEPCRKTLFYTAKTYLTLPISVWRAAKVNRSRYSSLATYFGKRIRAALHG
ncbi:sulfotransferase family protein [Roseovarius sp. D22-M7]|uniref:sulfotransferase family protein n=1 Tax=Roseovarius sp. D22-M7 TaxID=3127116 RepID=UPI00301002B8